MIKSAHYLRLSQQPQGGLVWIKVQFTPLYRRTPIPILRRLLAALRGAK